MYKTHYWEKSPNEYEEMFDKLSRVLAKDDGYKYGNLVESMLNRDAAEILARRGEVTVKPSPSPRKRSATLTPHEEELDRYRR